MLDNCLINVLTIGLKFVLLYNLKFVNDLWQNLQLEI